MPCNQDNCYNYLPVGDGTGEDCADPCGLQYDKEVFPLWDTARINAPTWPRDRIMYYYNDVCEFPGQSFADDYDPLNPNGPPDDPNIEVGIESLKNEYGGSIRKNLGNAQYWWAGNNDICPPFYYNNSNDNLVATQKVRYYNNYPSEISYEPIRSDSWFYYLYKTDTGVVGKPCYVTCYYMYTTAAGDSENATYYGIKREFFECPCAPEESYISYELEDGKITGEDDFDQYPLIWTCGTKNRRIAFQYPGKQIKADISVRAFGDRNITDSPNLGPWTLMLNSSGQSVNELFTELSTFASPPATFGPDYRYFTEVEIRQGNTVLGTLSTTFRGEVTYGTSQQTTYPDRGFCTSNFNLCALGAPSPGRTQACLQFNATCCGSLDGCARTQTINYVDYDSYLRVRNITISGFESNNIQSDVPYQLWFKLDDSDAFVNLGEVKFNNITRSSEKEGIPVSFHIHEPIQVSSGSVGQSITSLGFKEAWNGASATAYISSQGESIWKSKKTNVSQDFTLSGGTVIRMDISSYWDDDDEKYYTRWKINKIVRYGHGYPSGDGINYTGQKIEYLYYPNSNDPNRIGIALMLSTTQTGDWCEGEEFINVGDVINGWKVSKVKHTDQEFNIHIADLIDGTNNFAKDTAYTTSTQKTIRVKAGYGIKDRALIIGKYEFQRKEILYVTALSDPEVPQDGLDVIKPKLQAVITNGVLSEVQILNPGKNLKDPNIEPIVLSTEYPPTYSDKQKYLQFIEDGEDPEIAFEKSRGSGIPAKVEPIFNGNNLIGVKVISGGSGYSEAQPPFIGVPYIARSQTTVHVNKSSADKAEVDNKNLFNMSEAFKKIESTPYSYVQATLDEDNPTNSQTKVLDDDGAYQGLNKLDPAKYKTSETINKPGFSWGDYTKAQEEIYSEKSSTILKGPIKTLEMQKNLNLYVRPKTGFTKEDANYFLPPANPNKSVRVPDDYGKLVGEVQKINKNNTQVWKSYSDRQYNLIEQGNYDESVISSLSPKEKLELSSLKKVTTNLNEVNTQDIDQTTLDSGALSSIDEMKSVSISSLNADDGNYYNKEFKNFYRSNQDSENYSKLNSALNAIDARYTKDITSLWERDEDASRLFIYDGPSTSRVQYAFYNLPCASKEIKYMVYRYCPDPRRETFIKINLGVKVGFDYVNERGACTTCLYENSAVMTAWTQLKNEHGANNVSLSDAYCSTAFDFYDGEDDGEDRHMPFGSYVLPYSGFIGYGREDIYERFGPQYVYEGCHDYEISGYLTILHDLSLEAVTFSDSVNKYGNPYDFKCGRQYGKNSGIIDELKLNNMVSASDQYDLTATPQLSNTLRDDLQYQ